MIQSHTARSQSFLILLLPMFLGAILGFIVARIGTGNPYHGGPHGGFQIAIMFTIALTWFGQAVGLIGGLCLVNLMKRSLSSLQFLLAIVLAGAAAGMIIGIWREVDSAAFFKGLPGGTFSVSRALGGAMAGGTAVAVPGAILATCGVVVRWIFRVITKPGWARTHRLTIVVASAVVVLVPTVAYLFTAPAKVANHPLLTIPGPAGRIESLVFSPDGLYLASARSEPGGWQPGGHGPTSDVKMWNCATGKETVTFHGHKGEVAGLAFCPDGNRLAAAYREEMTVVVWNTKTGEEVLDLAGNADWLRCLAYSPDGRRIASGGGDVRVWDATNGQQLVVLSRPHGAVISSVAFSPDSKRVAAGSWESGDYRVIVWDAMRGNQLFALSGGPQCQGVAFSPDGKYLSSSAWKELTIWDATTGQMVRTVPTRGMGSGAYSSDWRRFAALEEHAFRFRKAWVAVTIWDMNSGRRLVAFRPHESSVYSLAFSPDGNRLASGGGDREVASEIRIWNASGEP